MLLLVLSFCLVLGIVRSLVHRFLHLKGIPGPKIAAYGRFWMMRTLASGDSANTYVSVNSRYGMYSLLTLDAS